MEMPWWIVAEGMLVLLLDLVAFGFLFRVYLKNRRRSALFMGLAWFFDFLAMVAAFSFHEIANSLLLVIFSILIFQGTIELLKEENGKLALGNALVFSSAPVLLLVYTWLFISFKKPLMVANPVEILDEILVAIAWVSAGLMACIGAFFTKRLEFVYSRKATRLFWGLFFFGLHLFPYPFFKDEHWYAPIGLTASLILIAFLTATYVSLANSEKFMSLKPHPTEVPELKPGVIVTTREEYTTLKEKLKDASVLAFTRDITNVPSTWVAYFITTAIKDEPNAISPTDLAKMSELVYNYYRRMSSANVMGVVVFDALEHVMMYNGLEVTLKFLSKLKDFAQLYNGSLIVVAEKEAFEEKEWNLLMRLME
ncbi:DUF835 domain-containing protein [Palaeococcus ferrophilus]|uniref:DUF835 domain-containing protein n=1 Tax=Palaeococcus ferrophilus TaxID=83868 RepID=UPI00064EB7B0|nr:DUF835 domain-containing protein [Palaeococcus ferrophilus]